MEDSVYSNCCDPLCSSLLLPSPSFERSWKVGITTTKEGWNVSELQREMDWGEIQSWLRHTAVSVTQIWSSQPLLTSQGQRPAAGWAAEPHWWRCRTMLTSIWKPPCGAPRMFLSPSLFSCRLKQQMWRPRQKPEEHWPSVGWKTSDFVVTLFKQQVPVCLSAPAAHGSAEPHALISLSCLSSCNCLPKCTLKSHDSSAPLWISVTNNNLGNVNYPENCNQGLDLSRDINRS